MVISRSGGDDVVAVGVKLDVDVEGEESCAHTPDVGSQRAPTYVLSFWDIKDDPLSDCKKQNKDKTKQAAVKARPDPISGRGLKSPNTKKKKYSST